jgi:hypothetical protein
VFEEEREEGALPLRPDTSGEAIMRRLGTEPIVADEFDGVRRSPHRPA